MKDNSKYNSKYNASKKVKNETLNESSNLALPEFKKLVGYQDYLMSIAKLSIFSSGRKM